MKFSKEMQQAAVEMASINEFGALHIFVSDGNCEAEHIEFCLSEPDITDEEQDFATRMLKDFTEEQRFAIWDASQVLSFSLPS